MRIKSIFFLLLLLVNLTISAQPLIETVTHNFNLSVGTTEAFQFNDIETQTYFQGTTVQRKRIVTAEFRVFLSENTSASLALFGEQRFEVNIDFFDNTGLEIEGFETQNVIDIALNEHNPAAFLIFDLRKQLIENGGNQDLDLSSISGFIVSNAQNNIEALQNIDVSAELFIEYAPDISTLSANNLDVVSATVEGKRVTLNWEFLSSNGRGLEFNNYQIQVAKIVKREGLYVYDFDNALLFETHSSRTSSSFIIGEGSGRYIWRIRPVSQFYTIKGDNRNYGKWTEGVNLHLNNTNSRSPFVFTISDPNEDNVWSYSKIISDQIIKENITFSDAIGNVKQGQTYRNTDETTFATQVVLDNLGRSSLVTLPMPIETSTEFQAEFFDEVLQITHINGDVEEYSSIHFDNDQTVLDNPLPVDSEGDFGPGYYKNANGYPYRRVIYYNDGSGRVKEVSGVGETHRIQNTAEKHTVRYSYEAVAADEILPLFGVDTPDDNTVIKQKTIDPNGVTTIKYISLQGKVIATCVQIDNDSFLLSDDETSLLSSVKSTSDNNLITSGKFKSEMMVDLPSNQNIEVSYVFDCGEYVKPCDFAIFDPEYSAEIKVTQNNQPVVWYTENTGSGSNDVDTYTVDLDESNCVENEVTGKLEIHIGPIESKVLSKGKYKIEKILTVYTNTDTDQTEENLRLYIRPFYDIILQWRDQVECVCDIDKFQDNIEYLNDNVFNNNALTQDFFTNQICDDYPDLDWCGKFAPDLASVVLEHSGDYHIDYVIDDIGERVVFYTPCCELLISLDWEQKGLCEYKYPNFEGYAWKYIYLKYKIGAMFSEYDESRQKIEQKQYIYSLLYGVPDDPGTAEDETYIGLLNGWAPGMFNAMVYHMINDKVDARNLETLEPEINESEKTDCAQKCSSDGGEDFSRCDDDGKCRQYLCSDLFLAWTAALSMLDGEAAHGSETEGFTFYASSESFSVSEEYDNAQMLSDNGIFGDAPGHDQFIDNAYSEKSKFVQKLMEKIIGSDKLSKAARKLGMPELPFSATGAGGLDEKQPFVYKVHLVYEFLNIVGTSFAKILTPEDESTAQPLEENRPLLRLMPYVNPQTGNLNKIPYNDMFEYNHVLHKYRLDRLPTLAMMNIVFQNNDFPRGAEDIHPATYYLESYSWDYYYYPIDQWSEIVTINETSSKPMFPLIHNPVFAYKYFMYEPAATRTDGDYELLQVLENGTCFNDPNDCENINGDPVACCELQGYPANMCYNDYDYPMMDVDGLVGPNDVLIETDGQGKHYKKIVDDFCSFGRLKCGYTHEDWSNEERAAFYSLVKKDNFKAVVSNEPTTYYDGKYKDEVLIRDIEYGGENFWETQTTIYKNNYVGSVYPTYMSSDEVHRLVDEKMFIPTEDYGDFQKYKFSDSGGETHFVPAQVVVTEGADPIDAVDITPIEFDALMQEQNCRDVADKRRPTIVEEIIELFRQKGYTIGGCPGDACIVPEEDIEVIADNIVADIKSRNCNVSTYYQTFTGCRSLGAGPTTPPQAEDYESIVELGVAGHPGVDESAHLEGTVLNSTSRQFTKYNNLYELTWYEKELLMQVDNWILKMDLPPCGETAHQCTANNNTYVDKEQVFVSDNKVNGESEEAKNNVIVSPSVQVPTITTGGE